MLNISMVSPVLDGSGWSEAGKGWALALDSAGANVSVRPLLFSGQVQPTGRLAELCNKPFGNPDVIIQHLPPHLFIPTSLAPKNICLFVTEGSHLRNTSWVRHLNMADEVWVTCQHNLEACLNSGVKKPIKVVPHACDVEKFNRSYPVIEPIKRLKAEGLFLFYFVGEFNQRKRLDSVVAAFHSEFKQGESVGLVIKTSRPGVSPDALKGEVEHYCRAAIEGTGLKKPIRPILVITDRLTEDALMGIHQACDCFVQVSYGEAWNQPAFDAMAFGKTPIVPCHGGLAEFISEATGYPVEFHLGASHGLDEAGWGTMVDVDVAVTSQRSLRSRMREAFESKDRSEGRAISGIENALDFSLEKVGKGMLTHLS